MSQNSCRFTAKPNKPNKSKEDSACPLRIELEPKYKQTIFAKNQPSTYETYMYAKL